MSATSEPEKVFGWYYCTNENHHYVAHDKRPDTGPILDVCWARNLEDALDYFNRDGDSMPCKRFFLGKNTDGEYCLYDYMPDDEEILAVTYAPFPEWAAELFSATYPEIGELPHLWSLEVPPGDDDTDLQIMIYRRQKDLNPGPPRFVTPRDYPIDNNIFPFEDHF